MLGGSLLLLLGPFLNWVTLNIDTGFGKLSASGFKGVHDWRGVFTLVVSMGVAPLWALGKTRHNGFHIALFGLSLLELLLLVTVLRDLRGVSSIARLGTEGTLSVSPGPGLLLSLLGVLAVLVPATILVFRIVKVHSRAATRSSPAGTTPGGWYLDPSGRHQLRWFEDQRWTEYASDNGEPVNDPLS